MHTTHSHTADAPQVERQQTRAAKLTLISLFLGVLATFAGRVVRRDHDLTLKPFDLLLLGLSSFRVGRMIAFEGAMLVIGVLLIGGKHLGMPDHHHGIMLGAAAGALFGVSDIAIKGLTGADGILGVVSSPWLAVTVGASVIAVSASARGLQEGEAVPVIAATSTAANVSCILGGIIVFGDPMPADALGIVVQIFAFTMVVVAALVTPPPVRAAAANA